MRSIRFLVRVIFILVLLFVLGGKRVFAQSGTRYLDPIFQIEKIRDVEYSQSLNYSYNPPQLQSHKLDICLPRNDALPRRPVMVYFHGGAFQRGLKDMAEAQFFCQEYARLGYVGITANYRLADGPVRQPPGQRQLHGIEDAAALVRWIRWLVDTQDNPYQMDPDRIIISGFSAGAIITVNLAYIDFSLPGSNTYYSGYSSDIQGGWIIAGGIDDPGLIKPNSTAPLYKAHGTKDDASDSDIPFPTWIYLMHQKLDQLNIPNELSWFDGPHCLVKNELCKVTNDYRQEIFKESRQFLYNYVINTGIGDPNNTPPSVNAGLDRTVNSLATNLSGVVSDDGLPNPPGSVVVKWRVIDGPGTVLFGDANSQNTTASFSLAGMYVLRLTVHDGQSANFDEVTINAGQADTDPPTVPGNLVATAVSSSQIALSWDPSTDDQGVAGYNIYRDGAFLNNTTNTNYSDTGLNASTQYCYTVS